MKFNKLSPLLPKLDFSRVEMSTFKTENIPYAGHNIPPPPLVPKLPMARFPNELIFPVLYQHQQDSTTMALSQAVMEGLWPECEKREDEKISLRKQNLRKLSGRAPYVRHRCKCKYLNLEATKHLHRATRCNAELCKMLTGFREQKNWKERMRVAGLKDHQKELKYVLETSGIKPRQGRWTEHAILTTAAEFLQSLQREISTRKGNEYVESLKPFRDYNEDNIPGKKIKKNPNCFLRFSVKMRNTFKEVLTSYLFNSEHEREDMVVDNRLVTKLISRTWSQAPKCRKSEDKWVQMKREEIRYWIDLAGKLAPELIENEFATESY
ncbi:hypothetical protein LOD99_12209 [Oopsacas minuta]|uniref:HMG box domain-containing protein n=1 Tax=Oopsacas minuta TaxID=111878 RepID=A0AAV7JEK9_9METZ|nr:hypothetical protein LOD99_12209 [Oopsacas minuta]